MNKPWVGYFAVGLLFISGILEFFGGFPKLGVFLIIVSIASLILRIYINKKLGGKNNNDKQL